MAYAHPTVIYKDPSIDRKDSVLRYIHNRVFRNNKNFLCAVTGQTGIGKSWACGSICEKWEELHGVGYDPNVHTFFSLRELLELVNREDGTIRNGSILMFDESQIDINARAWQSEANQIMAALISTFRHLKLVVLFPTPKLEFLDKQTRLLFHSEFRMLGFDKNTSVSKLEPRFLTDFNTKKNDFYRKRLIVKHKLEGRQRYGKYLVQDWSFMKPSYEWIEIYEAKKKKFSKDLRASLLAKLDKDKKKKNQVDRHEAFEKIYEIYKNEGENYVKALKMFPDITPRTIESLFLYAKKSLSPKPVVTTA